MLSSSHIQQRKQSLLTLFLFPQLPFRLQEETKIVRMVLSNVSIGISSAFSSDLISTTPFK